MVIIIFKIIFNINLLLMIWKYKKNNKILNFFKILDQKKKI